jgi:hypothetical protein
LPGRQGQPDGGQEGGFLAAVRTLVQVGEQFFRGVLAQRTGDKLFDLRFLRTAHFIAFSSP